MSEEQITWRSWWDGGGTDGPIATLFGTSSGWPTIYVLDHKGVIRYKNVRGEALDEAVDTLLEERSSDPRRRARRSEVTRPPCVQGQTAGRRRRRIHVRGRSAPWTSARISNERRRAAWS